MSAWAASTQSEWLTVFKWTVVMCSSAEKLSSSLRLSTLDEATRDEKWFSLYSIVFILVVSAVWYIFVFPLLIDWCGTLWRIFLIFIRVQAEWQVNSGCFLSVQYFCILRNVLSPFLDTSGGEFSLLSDGNILLYLNLLIIKDNYWDEFLRL